MQKIIQVGFSFFFCLLKETEQTHIRTVVFFFINQKQLAEGLGREGSG